MYSGEYDACDVTLSVYPHRASLKNMPEVSLLLTLFSSCICHHDSGDFHRLRVRRLSGHVFN